MAFTTLTILALITAPGDSLWPQLKARYLTMKSLAGEFSETIRPEYDTAGQRFSGTFSVQLPGRYRIEVTKPQRQTIVGNETELWFYFPSEKWAVRQPGGGTVPLLAFLEPMLDTAATAALFVAPDGKRRLVISSPDSGLSFSHYTFTLEPKELKIAGFSFSDAWGNSYDFRLSRQKWNPNIRSGAFRFTPPPGTAVDSAGP